MIKGCWDSLTCSSQRFLGPLLHVILSISPISCLSKRKKRETCSERDQKSFHPKIDLKSPQNRAEKTKHCSGNSSQKKQSLSESVPQVPQVCNILVIRAMLPRNVHISQVARYLNLKTSKVKNLRCFKDKHLT